jgi:hypothetical protein
VFLLCGSVVVFRYALPVTSFITTIRVDHRIIVMKGTTNRQTEWGGGRK